MNVRPITLASLSVHPIWVAWKREVRNGKPTKLPYDPKTGRYAKADDASTWTIHDEASQWAAKMRADGIGLMLGAINDAVVGGIDLDACRNANSKVIEPWAQAVIDRFGCYGEVSPSGNGVKLFFTFAPADLPAVEKLFGNQYGRAFKRTNGSDHPPAVEVYFKHRYFVVTGETISNTDDFRCVALADLEWLICDHGPKFAGQNTNSASAAASSKQNDQSRSAKAFRAGAALKAGGASTSKCATRCSNTKTQKLLIGRIAKGGQQRARTSQSLDKALGARNHSDDRRRRKTPCDLDELNDRFALLEAPRNRHRVRQPRRLHDDPGKRPEAPPRRRSRADRHERRENNEHGKAGLRQTPSNSGPDTRSVTSTGASRSPAKNCRRTRSTCSAASASRRRRAIANLILAHVHEVICSGDTVANEAMLNLMAWQMQNIGKPSRVIVIMRTKSHQAGKGLLLAETLLKIYGDAGFIPSSTDQVLGRFNDAIVGRAYVFLDEAMFFGDRRAADAIKSLVDNRRSTASRPRACRSSNARSASISGWRPTTMSPRSSKKRTFAIGCLTSASIASATRTISTPPRGNRERRARSLRPLSCSTWT